MTRYASPTFASLVLVAAWVAFLNVGFRVPLHDILIAPVTDAARWLRVVL